MPKAIVPTSYNETETPEKLLDKTNNAKEREVQLCNKCGSESEQVHNGQLYAYQCRTCKNPTRYCITADEAVHTWNMANTDHPAPKVSATRERRYKHPPTQRARA